MSKNNSFEIRSKEKYGDGILRILEHLNKNTARQIVAKSRIHLSIHESRKNIKKIRAILRLVRHEAGNTNYQELNNFFRNIAQQIAIVRDQTSQIELLENFVQKVNSDGMKKTIQKAIKQIEKQRKKEFENFYKKKTHHHIQHQLENNSEVIRKLKIKGDPEIFILRSLRKIYENCLDKMKIAESESTDEAYHNWRKQVKYLMYEMMLLKNAWPAYIEAYIDELNNLQKDLGNLHDLNLFNQYIIEGVLFQLDKNQKEEMLRFIYPKRKILKTQVHRHGTRLFSESARNFSERMFGIWTNSFLVKKTHHDSRKHL